MADSRDGANPRHAFLAVVVVVGGLGLFGAFAAASPVPASGTPRAPAASDPINPAISPGAALLSHVTYTVEEFEPPFAIRLAGFGNTELGRRETDWCDPNFVGSSGFVLPWKMGCRVALSVSRPFAVACGPAPEHPTSEELAATVLANPTLDVMDHGSLAALGTFAAGFDLDRYPTRAIEIRASRSFDPRTVDPDHCQLLDQPDGSGLAMPIRGDVNAMFVFVDVGDDLVVIRSGPGWDWSSVKAAQGAGYDFVVGLESIRDFDFLAP